MAIDEQDVRTAPDRPKGTGLGLVKGLAVTLKLERGDGDPISERIRAIWVTSERPHARTGFQQSCGDVPARVAEGACHHVNLRHYDPSGQ